MTAPTDTVRLQAGIEAILFLADEPVPAAVLAEALEVTEDVVTAEVEALTARFTADQRGIEVRRAGGGWRLYTSPLARHAIERWAVAGRTGRLTQAALETLAVIAYKQPISRQAIGDIRGVNADAAVRSLVARGLVAEVGRADGPGQAVLYGTTTAFLERLGLDRLEDLPPLTDFLPEAPAPDEPELGALREVRRRLAQGADAQGPGSQADDDADLLPPPTTGRGRAGYEDGMDQLSDELDRAARGAVDRLRQVRQASDLDDDREEAATAGEPADEATDGDTENVDTERVSDDDTEHPQEGERG